MSINRCRLQYILDAINENIFYKDREGRYTLATHVCNMLNSNGDSDFSIYGKTDMDIQPDKTLGKKFYNDNYGHEEGDVLIKTVVNNIKQFLRPEDLLIRLGGDEFLILLQHCNSNQGKMITNLMKISEADIKLQNNKIQTSYGICVANNEEELTQAICDADMDMYVNKKQSKKHYYRN